MKAVLTFGITAIKHANGGGLNEGRLEHEGKTDQAHGLGNELKDVFRGEGAMEDLEGFHVGRIAWW